MLKRLYDIPARIFWKHMVVHSSAIHIFASRGRQPFDMLKYQKYEPSPWHAYLSIYPTPLPPPWTYHVKSPLLPHEKRIYFLCKKCQHLVCIAYLKNTRKGWVRLGIANNRGRDPTTPPKNAADAVIFWISRFRSTPCEYLKYALDISDQNPSAK